MLVTIDWIKRNYDRFNSEFWGGRLPSIAFKINNSSELWGYAQYRFNLRDNTVIPICLTVSNFYDSPEEVKINTLLHEMIHIADYTFHPEHFIRNGRRISGKSYDAHGPVFFLPEARRINAHGYKIAARVQGWEQDASSLSTSNQRRLNSQIENGMMILMLHLNPREDSYHGKYGDWCFVKTDAARAKVWREKLQNDDWFKKTYDKAGLYTSSDPFFAAMRITTSGSAHYCQMTLEEFIRKHGMKFVKELCKASQPALSLWEEIVSETMDEIGEAPIENMGTKRAVRMINDFEGIEAIE